MRTQLLKLQKYNSTKAERIVGEILKRNRIKFRTKVRIANKEVDFLINDKFVIEIGDHKQSVEKNRYLLESGYHLKQLSNQEVYKNNNLTKFIISWLKEQV